MPPPTTFDSTTPLVGPATHWPAAVRLAIEPRRPALLDDGERATLDLGAGLPDGGQPGGGFGTIISIGGLTAFADLPAALARVHGLLSLDGYFRFIEPVGRPGWAGMLGASAGAHLPALRGTHIGRDVPAAVRSAGFLICRLERFTVPTSVWPLRDFVQAEARVYERPPALPRKTDDKTEGDSE